MRSQIEFLKRAIDRVQSAGPFGCYHFYKGVAYATSSKLSAAVPFDIGAEFSVCGTDLEVAISRMSSEPSIAFVDKTLTVKAGRLKATVPCDISEPPPLFDDGVEWFPLPATLVSALKVAVPFMVTDQFGWSSSIRLQDGRLTSINNKCGIDIAIHGLACPPSLVTRELAEFLIATDAPESYGFKPGSAFLFRWEDGRTLQSQLIDQTMPDAVERIFAAAGREAATPITSDWRAAYQDAAAITESVVEIRRDAIRVGRGSSRVTIEVEADIPEGHVSYWETKVLTPMVAAATSWNPAAYPKPALFKGDALYGLVSGIKQ